MRIITEIVGGIVLLLVFYVGITEVLKGEKHDDVPDGPAATPDPKQAPDAPAD